MNRTYGTIRSHVPRWETVSPVGLAALVAALHLAVLTGRVSVRWAGARPGTLVIWRMPQDAIRVVAGKSAQPSSRPIQTYSAGQLALAVGMAIVTLACWLHIMRLTGVHDE
ncbi:MAG: hypothetical protein ACUVXJ_02650 [Phycisphaerae bacterium]